MPQSTSSLSTIVDVAGHARRQLSSSPFGAVKPYYPHNAGHRGFKGLYPENTIFGFDQAITTGQADTIELDVQVASDGILVVSHDPMTKRCFGTPDHIIKNTPWQSTDTTVGLDTLVAKRITQEGKEAGSVNERGLPTFKRVAQRFASDERYTSARMLLDIKPTNEPSVIANIVQVLTEVNADLEGFWAQRVVLGVWKPDFLYPILKNAPMLKFMYIGASRRLARQFMATGNPQFIGLSMHYIAFTAGSGGPELMDLARDRGLLLYSWTINSPKWMRWAIANNLDGIVTDFPDRFQKLRDEKTDEQRRRLALSEKNVSWFTRHVTHMILYALLEVFVFSIMAKASYKASREARKGNKVA